MSVFCMDAHMHFDLYRDREEVLKYIETHHSYTIAVTNLPDIYRRYHGKYNNFKYTRLALGFHPELAFQYQNQMNVFEKCISETRYIGEVGLDYSIRDEENKKVQRNVFAEIVRLCSITSGKVMSVHSRRAEADCLQIMKDYHGKAILHWFSGSRETLYKALDCGYYFSINHQMLVSNNGRRIVDEIPLERILIESDAPFTKGLEKEYSISFIENVYQYLCKMRGIEVDELSNRLKNNFREVLS